MSPDARIACAHAVLDALGGLRMGRREVLS